MKFMMEVTHEWVREYEVDARDFADAEVEAAQRAKQEWADMFEETPPSISDFDIVDIG